jgi:dephospho-CoA kinase
MSDINRNALVIGITGGIACGKSETGRLLAEWGVAVCDADRVAHEIMRKGAPVYQRVVDAFGTDILDPNGEISRPTLGRIVFDDPVKRQCLNELVHPAVRKEITEWTNARQAEGREAAVIIPLMYESGMDDMPWDSIWCISSTNELILERLEQRGLARQEAEQRIAAQLPLEEKETRADWVILNAGTLEELKQRTREALEACRRKG